MDGDSAIWFVRGFALGGAVAMFIGGYFIHKAQGGK